MNPSLIAKVLIDHSELKEYFTSEEIKSFSDYFSCQEVEASSPVMSEGEPADCLMYLLSGKARVLEKAYKLA